MDRAVTLDNVLSWRFHTESILKKLNTRMYCLRKLRSFHVDPEILILFFQAVINSILQYCIVCWGGNVPKQEKARLDKLIQKAGKVIGQSQQCIDSLYQDRMADKIIRILTDEKYPLRHEFDNRRIDRSHGQT